jgi:hypothetical protein
MSHEQLQRSFAARRMTNAELALVHGSTGRGTMCCYRTSKSYLLSEAACFLPSQVPFSVSLVHLPESSPFFSFAVNW